jgi:hypothetical protein
MEGGGHNNSLNLSYYREIFYVVSPLTHKITKIIPLNIEELLTPISLAI